MIGLLFTIHRLPLTMRYPFSVLYTQSLIVNSKRMKNGKWKMVNASTGGA